MQADDVEAATAAAAPLPLAHHKTGLDGAPKLAYAAGASRSGAAAEATCCLMPAQVREMGVQPLRV